MEITDRLNNETKELLNLRFREKLQEITDNYAYTIRHILQTTAIGPGQQTALDRQYEERAKTILETWANLYLDTFIEEGLLPDAGELSKMGHYMEKIIPTLIPPPGHGHTLLPITSDAIKRLPHHTYDKLKHKVRRLELEQNRKGKRDDEITKAVQSIPTQGTPAIDFSFITDARMRAIIERDYAELQQLNPEIAAKAVLILSGGIIEGLLIDALVKSGEDQKETFEKFLKQLIYPAKNKGIIAQDSVGEWLRVFRNLVHPAKEIREGLPLTKDHARHARTSVDVIISEVRQWHSKNP